MTDAAPQTARSGYAPAIGAAAIAVVALGLSVGMLVWRGGAQREVLDAVTARCERSEPQACDALRNLCLKRNGDGCEALAQTILAAKPPGDVRDAMHLLSEACELRNRRACMTAARKLLDGDGIPKDTAEAARLLDRGCELGEREACGLKETVK
ncbi:MAG TPA: hypothetical protein VH062_06050 [Polyangiaceae bacterium]|jgi:TPR repeat protein|nr:hypothetical protein [Polyangiaceae bacterium]